MGHYFFFVSRPSELSGLHVEGGGLSNAGDRRELELKDAPQSCACSIPARRTRSLPHTGAVQRKGGGFLSSCLHRDSTSCTPRSCPFSFSRKRRNLPWEVPQLPGRHPPGREIQRTAEQALPPAPPCNGLGLLRVPPILQLLLPYTREKACGAHVRASWEIPVEASQS